MAPKADKVRVGPPLHLTDLSAALRAGWRDFRRAPQFGLFFSAVYVLGGLALVWLGAGQVAWVLTLSLGFPLVAPFAAAGLYEVSRRLERGAPLAWGAVLGVVWRERGRQLPWLGAIIVLYFLFWSFLAHMLFALVMGMGAMAEVGRSLSFLLSPRGLALVAVELGVGGVLAFALFALMAVSLPLVLDREVDFVTAMMRSLGVVRQSPVVMAVWAALIAGLTLLALLPAFLGLMVVLPVLGHATWHLYRRALV